MNETRGGTLELCDHPTEHGFRCTMPKGHDVDERATPHDACTWHVYSVKDRGPGNWYRFHIMGELVQGGQQPGEVKREDISWSIQDFDDNRYVLNAAHAR